MEIELEDILERLNSKKRIRKSDCEAIIEKIAKGDGFTENDIIDYKRDFHRTSLNDYAKWLVGFSNNKGGMLIFGVDQNKEKDTFDPIGLNDDQEDEFNKVSEADIGQRIDVDYSHRILFDKIKVEFEGKVFGFWIAYEVEYKPIISSPRNQQSAQIFFSYVGQVMPIKYPDLQNALLQTLKKFSQKFSREGISRLKIWDEVEDEDGNKEGQLLIRIKLTKHNQIPYNTPNAHLSTLTAEAIDGWAEIKGFRLTMKGTQSKDVLKRIKVLKPFQAYKSSHLKINDYRLDFTLGEKLKLKKGQKAEFQIHIDLKDGEKPENEIENCFMINEVKAIKTNQYLSNKFNIIGMKFGKFFITTKESLELNCDIKSNLIPSSNYNFEKRTTRQSQYEAYKDRGDSDLAKEEEFYFADFVPLATLKFTCERDVNLRSVLINTKTQDVFEGLTDSVDHMGLYWNGMMISSECIRDGNEILFRFSNGHSHDFLLESGTTEIEVRADIHFDKPVNKIEFEIPEGGIRASDSRNNCDVPVVVKNTNFFKYLFSPKRFKVFFQSKN